MKRLKKFSGGWERSVLSYDPECTTARPLTSVGEWYLLTNSSGRWAAKWKTNKREAWLCISILSSIAPGV